MAVQRGVHRLLDEAGGERFGGGVEALDRGFERIGRASRQRGADGGGGGFDFTALVGHREALAQDGFHGGQQLLGFHLEAWLRANRPAAREWIETHDALPAEQAAKLLLAAGAVSTPKN